MDQWSPIIQVRRRSMEAAFYHRPNVWDHIYYQFTDKIRELHFRESEKYTSEILFAKSGKYGFEIYGSSYHRPNVWDHICYQFPNIKTRIKAFCCKVEMEQLFCHLIREIPLSEKEKKSKIDIEPKRKLQKRVVSPRECGVVSWKYCNVPR